MTGEHPPTTTIASSSAQQPPTTTTASMTCEHLLTTTTISHHNWFHPCSKPTRHHNWPHCIYSADHPPSTKIVVTAEAMHLSPALCCSTCQCPRFSITGQLPPMPPCLSCSPATANLYCSGLTEVSSSSTPGPQKSVPLRGGTRPRGNCLTTAIDRGTGPGEQQEFPPSRPQFHAQGWNKSFLGPKTPSL